MAKTFSVQEFIKQFPNDDACLDHLMQTRYGTQLDCPKCGKHGKFSRVRKIPAYQCAWCGHHIHPMVGTPFEKSHTPLQKWFYAMYLFTASRNGVSARELQRHLSVTLKTAWRIGHEIRKYLGTVDGNTPLSGTVEVDETLIGGKRSGGKRGRGAPGKTVVFGMLEKAGDVMTHVVPDVKRETLYPLIEASVVKDSTIHSDELRSYAALGSMGYNRETVNHGRGEYARNGVHVNGLEGFWSVIQRSIRGTHVWVSPQHMDKHLVEFEYRHNMRKSPELMFPRLLWSF